MERLHDWLKPWMPRFLGLLYAANATGEPTDLDSLTEQLLEEYEHRLPPGDPELFASIAAVTVRQALADLAHHGAVVLTGADDEPEAVSQGPQCGQPRLAPAQHALTSARRAIPGCSRSGRQNMLLLGTLTL
jgi:hypothetical protein